MAATSQMKKQAMKRRVPAGTHNDRLIPVGFLSFVLDTI
jgi:hypothetical protein